MQKKIAFITGGNRGIGYQTAFELGTKHGIKVVIGARDPENGREAVQKLRAAGADAEFLEFDVNRPEHIDAAYQYFAKEPGHLDILINNAGVAAGGFPPIGSEHTAGEVQMSLVREVFDTNFFAPVALAQKMLPLLKKSPAGRIVNLSSILGSLALHADPNSGIYHAKSFAYDASKTALNAFTVHLAYELRDTNVKVNSAHPGWVKTDMGGKDAPLNVEDGAKTPVALATLPETGPTGGYFHMGQSLPW